MSALYYAHIDFIFITKIVLMVQKKNKKDPRHNLSASKIETHNFTDKQPICFSFNQVTQNYVHISAHVQSIN